MLIMKMNEAVFCCTICDGNGGESVITLPIDNPKVKELMLLSLSQESAISFSQELIDKAMTFEDSEIMSFMSAYGLSAIIFLNPTQKARLVNIFEQGGYRHYEKFFQNAKILAEYLNVTPEQIAGRLDKFLKEIGVNQETLRKVANDITIAKAVGGRHLATGVHGDV